MKTKPLTRRQLTEIIMDYEERFSGLTDTLQSLRDSQPDYAGGLVLNIKDAEGKYTTFYMVSKFCVVDPFITFYHLLPANNEPVTINSFPDKPTKKSTKSFIKSLGKEDRFNLIHERMFIPSVERAQFTGYYTYSRLMELEDNKAVFDRPENTVVDFPTSEED